MAFRQIRSRAGIRDSCGGAGRSARPGLLQDLDGRLAVAGRLPGQQVVEHGPQAVDVGPGVDPLPLASGLLGCHVAGEPRESRSAALPRCAARPKSTSAATPSSPRTMFDGLTSRCSRPQAWTASSPSATCSTSRRCA